MIRKEGVGERGKTAQDLTKKYLDQVNKYVASFSYIRMQDARAARGALKKQLSDYICWWHLAFQNRPYCMPLEVKSTEHDYRLPKDALSQHAMLVKSAKCGTNPHILVLFKGLEQWRIAPISYFTFGVPSWDMRDLPLYPTAQAALESTGIFPVIPCLKAAK